MILSGARAGGCTYVMHGRSCRTIQQAGRGVLILFRMPSDKEQHELQTLITQENIRQGKEKKLERSFKRNETGTLCKTSRSVFLLYDRPYFLLDLHQYLLQLPPSLLPSYHIVEIFPKTHCRCAWHRLSRARIIAWVGTIRRESTRERKRRTLLATYNKKGKARIAMGMERGDKSKSKAGTMVGGGGEKSLQSYSRSELRPRGREREKRSARIINGM